MDKRTVPTQKARLIVLVPESLAGDLDFARKIYSIAMQACEDVLYLTLLERPGNILTTSRRIATMKAVTESNLVRVGCLQVPTGRWLQKLREILRADDTVICHDMQYVRQGAIKSIKAADFLASTIPNEIIMIRGYYKPQKVLIVEWLNSIVFWFGSLGILGGFSLVEIQIMLALRGTSGKVALAAVVALEFGVVLIWNKINHTT